MHAGRETDRQADGHEEANVRFSLFIRTRLSQSVKKEYQQDATI